jgi:recombination protein RecA
MTKKKKILKKIEETNKNLEKINLSLDNTKKELEEYVLPKIEYTKEQEEKRERLHKLMNETNREFKSVVLKFAKDEPVKTKIPFGLTELDAFTGGGIISGNVSIIYGSEGSGKSTLAYNLVASAQKEGKLCAYYDLEHMFDSTRAIKMGVNIDNLLLSEEFDTAEEAMDSIISLSRAKAIDLIVIDSVQALSTKEEQESKGGKERKMEENEIASLAKKMGKFLRKVGTPLYKGKVALLLIGQARTGGLGSFITHEELTGGRAQKFWSLLTLYIRKGQNADAPTQKVELEELDENGKKIKITKRIGFDAVIKVEKTKTNSEPEGSDIHLPFYFSSGFIKNK